jgi:hypothetical protein
MVDKLLALNDAAAAIIKARAELLQAEADERTASRKTFQARQALLTAEDNFNRADAEYMK